jgi:hypothetical protein
MLQAAVFVSLVFAWTVSPAYAAHFKAGFAQVDITPTKPTPMWGYGARHDALSEGVRDPLFAKAVVVDVGEAKVALVGLDLGRSPRPEQVERIREAVNEKAGVGFVLLVASHTHHGPVIELKDAPGKGKGVYDDAVAYASGLEARLIDVIVSAAMNAEDARIGWGSAMVPMNRNRHTKIEPKVTDSELTVVRFDNSSGEPIAIAVNFAAHPTMLPVEDLRFSAEYPGEMMNEVARVLGTNCLFLQGAAGDLSCNPPPGPKGIEAFGKALAAEVIKIASEIETRTPEAPSVQGLDTGFEFETRMDFTNPQLHEMFGQAFFPELAAAYVDELEGNIIRPHLTTVLINRELAIVGGSGEFFCSHAVRMKERARIPRTLFVGYCNGHHMYFPTIEAAAEGGYGADPTVSWVPLGAGELMMNQALTQIYTKLGKYDFISPEI